MAQLGFRTIDEMIGRVDWLDSDNAVDHWKAKGLDLSPLLHKPNMPASLRGAAYTTQDHGLDKALDNQLIEAAMPALEARRPVEIRHTIRNADRTVGTMLRVTR